jgi:hypothetical protein
MLALISTNQSEPEAPGSTINQFNMITVRHFSGETLAAVGEEHVDSLQGGLALSGTLPRDLAYDFTRSWDIRGVENVEDEDVEGVLMIEAERKDKDLTFT